jgi:peptide-methionine (S)-S-oxide reductase
VGYTGGTTADPTYYNLGDHSESIQIEFDLTVVSYAELLDIFWESHNPQNEPSCTQYMSAIFYHTEAQRQLAEQTKQAQEAIYGEIFTEIAEAQTFYRAEDYHQKWYLRGYSVLMRDFGAIYPDPRDFTDSTAAARVNGVVGRHYTAARLEAEIASFGLSAEANEFLRTFPLD